MTFFFRVDVSIISLYRNNFTPPLSHLGLKLCVCNVIICTIWWDCHQSLEIIWVTYIVFKYKSILLKL